MQNNNQAWLSIRAYKRPPFLDSLQCAFYDLIMLTYQERGVTRIVAAEYMTHPDESVAERITGFFRATNFLVSTHENGRSIRITPDVPGDNIPAISYWRTSSEEKYSLERWVYYDPEGDAEPSEFARGWRYRWLQDSVEIPLELPTDQDVINLYTNGGDLLRRHTYAGPRNHPEGTLRKEIRVEDPTNMSQRWTGPHLEYFIC